MATEQKMLVCSGCARRTPHLYQRPSHILHLILTVFTLGVWVVIWIIISATQGHPRCTQCGKVTLDFTLGRVLAILLGLLVLVMVLPILIPMIAAAFDGATAGGGAAP